MKGNKLVFAVILSLIVCLLLVPTCAFAEEGNTTDNPEITDNDQGGVSDHIDTGSSEGGSSEDGNSEDGDSEDGNSEDGSSEDGNSEDGSSEDGDSEDGSSEDGSSEDGNSEDGDSEDGNSEDGSTEDGSSEDGDSKDGIVPDSGDSTDSEPPKGFQVELTFNGKVVKLSELQGGESHDFLGLLHELGIDGTVSEVNDPAGELFNVTSDENGMHFNTLMAFGDPYELVVTVDGVQYVITVTDDGSSITVEEGETLQEAINRAVNGQTVVLSRDFNENIVIDSGKNITIDLNGKTLKNNGSHTIVNNGVLTINDSKNTGVVSVVNGDARLAVLFNYGTLTVNAGKYQRKDWYCVKNFGDMTINGGNFPVGTSGNALIVNGWYSENNENAWNNDFSYKFTGKDATMTINGGEYTGRVKNDYHSVLVINNGATLTDGIQNSGSATINGGSISSSGNWIIAPTDSKSVTTINAGSFSSKGNLLYSKADGTLNISNGTFNTGVNKPSDIKMNIKGGVFSDTSVENYLGKDVSFVEKDGKVYVNVKAPSANTIVLTDDASVVKYEVIEGKDQTWTKSTTEGVKYVLNADANGIIKVLINGEQVDFEIDEDGKIVISAEVLEKLEAGKYEIEFVFADGSCKTELYVK